MALTTSPSTLWMADLEEPVDQLTPRKTSHWQRCLHQAKTRGRKKAAAEEVVVVGEEEEKRRIKRKSSSFKIVVDDVDLFD